MGGGPELAVLFYGRIIMGGQLLWECSLLDRTFLGWAPRNGSHCQASCFPPLLEVAPDRRKRDLKGGSNLGLAIG